MLAHFADLQVNYERSTPGKDAIVFIHSLGGDLSLFEPQALAFATDYDVIRYDLRGHGGSSLGRENPSLGLLAEDLGRLLDQLGIRAAHLVGQSIGGMIALALATQRTLENHTLCLFDTIAWTSDEWNAKYTARAAQVDNRGMSAIAEDVALAALGKTSHDTRPAIRDGYRARIACTDAAGYSWCCKSMIGFDLRPGLAHVSCPVQLLAGDEDVVTPLRHLREVARYLGNAPVREIQGAGHVPFIEVPHVATDLVRKWIEVHPLATGR